MGAPACPTGKSAIAVLREVAARLRREDRQHVRAGYRPLLHLTTQGWRIVALCVGVLRWCILKCSQATTNNDLDQWHPGLYRAPVKIFCAARVDDDLYKTSVLNDLIGSRRMHARTGGCQSQERDRASTSSLLSPHVESLALSSCKSSISLASYWPLLHSNLQSEASAAI